MIFKDSVLKRHTIEKQYETIADIKKIVEDCYALGKVVGIKRITIGETNLSYSVTTEKDGARIKYFAQLFNAGKSLTDVKHEMSLREYFMQNTKTSLKCAEYVADKDGGYAVICDCPELGRPRYFCMFDFMAGSLFGDRDVWAFGRITYRMIDAYAKGLAWYHVGAFGYEDPPECKAYDLDYSEELVEYKRVFTEEFQKRRYNEDLAEYYEYFAGYHPRIMELLERYTDVYEKNKGELQMCICHMDPGANNYMFDENLKPIAVCDLDWAQAHLRLFDITWAILESFCAFDPENITTDLDVDKCAAFIDAYDKAIEEAEGSKLYKLTVKERELIPEIFQLVSIRFGFYNPWLLILTDNPTATNEYCQFWGNWSKTAMEFVEEHMEEFKQKLMK